MKNKIITLVLSALLFALCFCAEAQPQQARVAKIGWLAIRPASAGRQEEIRRMLREIGYVEGKNMAFEFRFADDKLERLPRPG